MRVGLTTHTYTVRVAYAVAVKYKTAFRAVNYLHMGGSKVQELKVKAIFDDLTVETIKITVF
jgi:hypothetical protein